MITKKMIEDIRKYTNDNNELSQSHHFLFDLRLGKRSDTYEYMVIGMNPGESKNDWEICNEQTEETNEFDFHERYGNTRANVSWTKLIQSILDTDNVVQSELFFWSSNSTGTSFEDRFKYKFKNNPHLEYCRDKNIKLIEYHNPKIIVFTGISTHEDIAKLYGLKHVKTVNAENGHKLIVHYKIGEIPWIFTKHWSGARGFSNDQKKVIKQYIDEIKSGLDY